MDEAKLNEGIITHLRTSLQATEADRDRLKAQFEYFSIVVKTLQDSLEDSRVHLQTVTRLATRAEEDRKLAWALQEELHKRLLSDLKKSTDAHEELERAREQTLQENAQLKARLDEKESELKRNNDAYEELKRHQDLEKQEIVQLKVNLDKKESELKRSNDASAELKRDLELAKQVTGIFPYKFHNISNLTEEGALSDMHFMRDLAWQIRVFRGADHLGTYLRCSPSSPSAGWSCRARHKITLRKNSVAEDGFSKEGIHTFTDYNDSSCSMYVKWTEVLRKCVKDDSITIKMEIWAEQPQGL